MGEKTDSLYKDPTKFMDQYKFGIEYSARHKVEINLSELVSRLNESFVNGDEEQIDALNSFIALLALRFGNANYRYSLKAKLDRVEEIFLEQNKAKIINTLKEEVENGK
jgi:hypothetical protein